MPLFKPSKRQAPKLFKLELVSGSGFHVYIESFNQVGVWVTHSQSTQLIFIPENQIKKLSHIAEEVK